MCVDHSINQQVSNDHDNDLTTGENDEMGKYKIIKNRFVNSRAELNTNVPVDLRRSMKTMNICRKLSSAAESSSTVGGQESNHGVVNDVIKLTL